MEEAFVMAPPPPPAKIKSKYCHLDVVVQILIRLPVCSIVKCLCVCKEWYRLITSREFIATHLSHRLNNPTPANILIQRLNSPSIREIFGLYCDNESSCLLQTIPPPFKFEESSRQHLRIIGSVHGLLCFFINNSLANGFIWNPSIRRYLEIPESHVVSGTKSRDTYVVMGFGFDSLRNDYKVVKMNFIKVPHGTANCLEVGIYSLKERAWRELDVNKVRPCFIECWQLSSCFTNGSIHWIAEERSVNYQGNLVLSLDMNNECFNRIKLPQDLIEAKQQYLSIAETKGLLSIFHYFDMMTRMLHGGYFSCHIWVLKEHDAANSWTKSYDIRLEEPVLLKVLEVRENEEILMAKNVPGEENGTELVSYDLTTRETKAFGTQVRSFPFYGKAYSGSLLLLDSNSGADLYVEPKFR